MVSIPKRPTSVIQVQLLRAFIFDSLNYDIIFDYFLKMNMRTLNDYKK